MCPNSFKQQCAHYRCVHFVDVLLQYSSMPPYFGPIYGMSKMDYVQMLSFLYITSGQSVLWTILTNCVTT